MCRDFEIKTGIYLVQSPHELDLHNNFDSRPALFSRRADAVAGVAQVATGEHSDHAAYFSHH
jgi:hypothetical protein